MHTPAFVLIEYSDRNATVQQILVQVSAPSYSVRTAKSRAKASTHANAFSLAKLSGNQGEKALPTECHCRNGGKCYGSATGGKLCRCPHGFSGPSCELSIGEIGPVRMSLGMCSGFSLQQLESTRVSRVVAHRRARTAAHVKSKGPTVFACVNQAMLASDVKRV